MKLIVILGIVGAAGSAMAQDTPDMEKLAALGKPGAKHKFLESFVGKWTVDVTYKIGEMEGKSKAECEYKSLHDGRYFLAEYRSEMMGQPFIVNQTLGYDPLRDKFFDFQIESGNTSYLLYSGTCDTEGKKFDLYGDSFDPMTMKPAKMHIVKRVESKDKFVVEWYTVREGGREEKTVTLAHTRKKE